MDYIQSLRDSVETSVALKLFSSHKVAAEHHVFNTTYQMVSISDCKSMENIDPVRFSSDPYPAHDRPRGQKDLDSPRGGGASIYACHLFFCCFCFLMYYYSDCFSRLFVL